MTSIPDWVFILVSVLCAVASIFVVLLYRAKRRTEAKQEYGTNRKAVSEKELHKLPQNIKG